MRLSRILADPQLSQSGVEVCYVGDFYITIRRWDTKFLVEAYGDRRALMRRTRGLDQEQEERVLKEAYAEHIVLGWRGLEDDNGQEIPFSSERCLELFLNPDAEDFFSFVRECANDFTLFQAEEREGDSGNSQATSNGTSGTAPVRGSLNSGTSAPASSTQVTPTAPSSTTVSSGSSTPS